MFDICLVITDLSRSNNCAICSCDSHTFVSFISPPANYPPLRSPPSPHANAHTKCSLSRAKQQATSCQYVSIAKALTSIFYSHRLLPISYNLASSELYFLHPPSPFNIGCAEYWSFWLWYVSSKWWMDWCAY